MKTKITFFCLLIVMSFGLKAQTYVTIPDTAFVSWLQTNYPTCMNGNQMDTTCIEIKNEDTLIVVYINVEDLSGIEYFINLKYLVLSDLNYLYSLPTLPNSITDLRWNSNNTLASLPTLPNSLEILWCNGNQYLTSLPTLPNSITYLNFSYSYFTSLPTLPNSLIQLWCDHNQLTSLPSLPDSLQLLYCDHNHLTSLPNLPNTLTDLGCNSNELISLPTLPNSISTFDVQNNNISCFPIFPVNLGSGQWFQINDNPFKCLPNYVGAMDAATLAFPLCIEGDSINNPNACNGLNGIVGSVYNDINGNCLLDSADQPSSNILLKLYDNSNNLLAQTYSFSNGTYAFNFLDLLGDYTVKVDTLGSPYTIPCVFPGIDSMVTFTTTNSLINNVNFEITCKPGFDIGIMGIMPSGLAFPGLQHRLRVFAGDISNWNNLHCASGISGQVQVTVTGPVSFNGIVSGSLTPVVSGNVFTYNIADFGSVNMQQDFRLLFKTDTTAQSGDQICVNVNVTPTAGDNNTSNNNYQFCYQVGNSFDPNVKEVYPVDVVPGFQDYLTYTIHFQNTGTAPAMNIRLLDNLSNNLDLESFQVVNYSHYNIVSLDGNQLTVRFPNIQLPDSSSNLLGSQGFIQYRIKPKANLPAGTQIQNNAFIYFDYNAPVLTNTTTNHFLQAVSVNENKSNLTLSIYPNPGKGIFNLKMTESGSYKINVYNILGECVYQNYQGAKFSDFKIDISNQANGIYIVRVVGGKHSFNQRIIKQ